MTAAQKTIGCQDFRRLLGNLQDRISQQKRLCLLVKEGSLCIGSSGFLRMACRAPTKKKGLLGVKRIIGDYFYIRKPQTGKTNLPPCSMAW
jgi:hypothetical protein